jgi:flagellar assembly factor FliW
VPDRAENATANLLGPLVINRHSNRGVQAVLNERWSTRELLFPPVTVQVR